MPAAACRFVSAMGASDAFWLSGVQQDAHEFLTSLLQVLEVRRKIIIY